MENIDELIMKCEVAEQLEIEDQKFMSYKDVKALLMQYRSLILERNRPPGELVVT